MEILAIEINKAAIYDKCNAELNLLRSLSSAAVDLEIVMHTHGEALFDKFFTNAIHIVLNKLRRITKDIEQDVFMDNGGSVTMLVAPTCKEQADKLQAVVERFIIARIIEKWAAGRIEAISSSAAIEAAEALAELNSTTFIGSFNNTPINFI